LLATSFVDAVSSRNLTSGTRSARLFSNPDWLKLDIGPDYRSRLPVSAPIDFQFMTQIDSLIDDFLKETFDENPVAATSLGVDGYDHLLGDYSVEGIARNEAQVDTWLTTFESIGDEGLTLDQQVDRDLALSSLRGSKIMRDWTSYKRDPGTYLGPGTSGVFALFQHRLHPDNELAAAAASRMQSIPRVLAEGKRNLDASLASPLVAGRALGQCNASIHYFRKMVPTEVPEGKDRDLLVDAGEIAAAAHEDFAEFLGKFVSGAGGTWAIGQERYSALLEEKEKLGYGVDEMLERGKTAYDDLDKEMSAFTQQWKGTSDWLEVVEELNDDHPTTQEEMRKEYEDWTERARQFLKDKDLVTFPEGEECRVVPSPHFQRPILAVASYSSPPPFKSGRIGHFYVPFAPEGTSPEEIQKRLASNNRIAIPTTSVHEAYPGHHWHLVKMQDNPRKLRKVLRTSYFTEGWALYTERMMREEGFYDDPAHELGYMVARIFRAARIVVDTSLHAGKMTFDEALTFMMERTGMGEPTSRAEVGRYCSWPTQAPSYLTGSLEIERMRRSYLDARKGTLKQFHDSIATSGGLPIGLAEKALMQSS